MRVFFDTNIYNHLNKNEDIKILIDAKDTKKIEIFGNPNIFEELFGTFEKDVEKGKELVTRFELLISDRVIHYARELLKNDIDRILLGKITNIYLDHKTNHKFFNDIQDLKKGIVNEHIKKVIEYNKKDKKRAFESSKEGKRLTDPIFHNFRDKYKTLDDFFHDYSKIFSVQENIIKILRKNRLHEEHNLEEVSKIIENNLNHLHYLNLAIKIFPFLPYWYNIKNMRPKHGDIWDITILICLLSIDYYVNDDEDARKMFNFIFPEKKTVDINEFLNIVK